MVYNGTRLQAGAYGIALLHSKYTGPSIQIKNGSSGTPTDFYPAVDGTSTLKTSSGTSLTSFLSGAIAYVTKWYDQTGNANHATAAGTTLPTLNTTSNVVDFGPTGYFTLLDGSYPTGNSPYTYLFKQGSVPGGIICVAFKGGSGINAANGYLTYFTRSDDYLVHQWSGGALQIPSTASSTANSVIVCTYLEGTSYPSVYKNNVNIPMAANGIIRNQDATQNYLGSYDGTLSYKSTMPYFYWLPYPLGSSDRVILGNTTYYSDTVYPILARYTTSIWLDTSVSGNFVLSGSNVTTWKDKTANNFNLTSAGTITYNSTSPTSVLITANSYLLQNTFNMLTSKQTWFFVISFPTVGSYSIVGINNTGRGFDYVIKPDKFIIYNHNNADLDGIYFNIALTVNTRYLISVSFNTTSTSYADTKTNSIMRLNGNTQNINIANTSTSSYSLTGTSQSLLVGAIANGTANMYANNSSFNMYEIIGINNQSLTMNDIQIAENYLNTKWNLGYTIN